MTLLLQLRDQGDEKYKKVGCEDGPPTSLLPLSKSVPILHHNSTLYPDKRAG